MTASALISIVLVWVGAIAFVFAGWALQRRFWGRHVAGPRGFLHDYGIVNTPILLVATVGVTLIILDAQGRAFNGYGVLVAVMAALSIACSFLPVVKQARLRLLQSRYPQELSE